MFSLQTPNLGMKDNTGNNPTEDKSPVKEDKKKKKLSRTPSGHSFNFSFPSPLSTTSLKTKKVVNKKEEEVSQEDNHNASISNGKTAKLERKPSKRNVGGLSITPTTHRSSSSFLDPDSNHTFGMSIKKSPKTPSSPTDVAQPTIEKLGQMALLLKGFAEDYQKKIQTLQQMRQENSGEDKHAEWTANEQEITQLGQKLLKEELGSQWEVIRDLLDTCFESHSPEESPTKEEDSRILCKIDFYLSGFGALMATGKQAKANTKSLHKSLKDKEHIKHACEFLESLTLDFKDGLLAFESKNNLKVLNQFNNHSTETDTATLIFNYVKSLIVIAELLKYQGAALLNADKHDPHVAAARKLVKHFDSAKELKKVEQEIKTHEINLCCQDCAECVMHLVEELVKRFKASIKQEELPEHVIASMSKGFEENVKNKLISYEKSFTSFGGDMRRALVSKFFNVSTDKKIDPPSLTKEVRQQLKQENQQGAWKFYYDLLQFFMLNLEINSSDNNELEFDPLQHLTHTQHIIKTYDAFEEAWQKKVLLHFYDKKCGINFSEIKITGAESFKLLMDFTKDRSIPVSLLLDVCKQKYGIDLEKVPSEENGELYELLNKLKKEDQIDEKLASIICEKKFGTNFHSIVVQNVKLCKPLLILKVTESSKAAYDVFEEQWGKEEILKNSPKIEGIFKILPLLRSINQSQLYAVQKAIQIVCRHIAKGTSRVTREIDTVGSRKDLKEGKKLDRETKSNGIHFKDDKVSVKVGRQVALEKPPVNSMGSPTTSGNELIFTNCIINTSMTLTSPIQDMQNWQMEKHIEIERPKSENSNMHFLHQYANLIATIEMMDFTYTVKNV